MKQFTLRLSKDEQRPILHINRPFALDAMLDTGAIFPIWVASEELLREIGGILIARNQPFGGFGGMTTGNMYRIPCFYVGELVFPDLPILVSPHNLPCQILLSATMFNRLIYEIDDQYHNLNVTIPDTESNIRNLVIESKNGRLYIFCASEEK